MVAAAVIAAACAGPAPSLPAPASATPYPSAPSGDGASGSALPASSPASSTNPGGEDGAWTAVQPKGLPQAATLVPTSAGPDSVARTTSFLLTSLDARSAVALADRVVADPPVQFTISASGAAGAVLRPTAKLAASTRYRLSLVRPDGTVEASWTARTAGPLQVTDTIPGDTATGVPLDTGIEVAFDQAGVTGAALASHFTISPAAKGHFEASGKSVAFAPDAPLQKGTLYTVTVHHGLPLAGTGETLASDVVFRFETAATVASEVRVWPDDALVDASPRERAAISITIDVPEDATAPRTVPLTVHRLGGLNAAMTAWSAISKAPDWTLASTRASVPTSGLSRVLTSNVRVQHVPDGPDWVQVPRVLPVGWYVVTIGFAGIPRQLVLQVTDAATFAVVTKTKTVVWVNDLATRAPAAGATATLDGQRLAGSTNGSGLLVATTPARIAKDGVAQPMLVVRHGGRSTFRPIDTGGFLCAECTGKGDRPSGAADPWWTLLQTDRAQYRPTDTVNVLGVVKSRASGAVPGSVSVAVYADEAVGADAAPILTRPATPDARGMYATALSIADLPVGYYRVRAVVDGANAGEVWIQVATIRKPAYALSVATDRHAVIGGSPLGATVQATFFEGTPVAGVALGLSGNGDEEAVKTTVTTDASGHAAGTVTLTSGDEQSTVASVDATPELPEEADLGASAQVAVFAGSAYLTIDGSLTASRVTVRGAVNSIAFDRYEQPGADPWEVDPRGAPRAGAAVRIETTARYWVRQQDGTAYNFITKRVEPQYTYEERTIVLPARTVRTDAKGAFSFSFATTHDADSYDLTATYRDEAGRTITAEGWASSGAQMPQYDAAGLRSPDGRVTGSYSIGDAVRVQFVGGVPGPTATRYLFFTLQQGLRSATVTGSPAFHTTFTAASVPDIAIDAVRFNGSGYDVVGWPYRAAIDRADRSLKVSVTPDKARYQPGDTATVDVRTLGPDGKPVAASVFVGVIDEKLYAIGAAYDQDPLPELYATVPDGVIGAAQSHQVPSIEYGGGGGDTTGGGGETGGRTDFRDWLLAKVVHTSADGRAAVTVALSDDLTSWRVAATALDSHLDAGVATAKLPVGLPFFVDAVLAPEYLATDRPVLRVRSYGAALQPGTKVTFAVSSDTLPMTRTSVSADAFGSAYVPLPALSVGTHTLRIAGTAVVAGQTLSDSMVRTFRVVARRTTQLRTTWSALAGATAVTVGTGMTRIVLVDAGQGRVVPLLEELAVPGAVRSDQELASALASRVLAAQFGLPTPVAPDPNGLDVYRTDDGLAIVSWGSTQLDVTALAAMTGDPRLPAHAVDAKLADVAASGDETRARRLLALAGLAALGEPVTGQIRDAAAQTDLTVEEQVNLALAALEAGDEALAGRLEQQLLAQHGLRRADQVRIDPGPDADATVVTARLAIVAASLGDPLAAEMDAYVAAHPSPATLVVLERALAAQGWARRVAGAPAQATVVVDGASTTAVIEAGQAIAYNLTPAQAASAKLMPLSGSVMVVQTWDAPLAPSSLTTPDALSLQRTASPTGPVPATGTVIVTFHVTLPTSDGDGCWRVVDEAPSGLAPIPWYGTHPDSDADPGFDVISPTFMDGQRVEFGVCRDPLRSDYTLRYVARVVTPGTYTWEPAVIQSTSDPSSGATVAATTISIQTPGG